MFDEENKRMPLKPDINLHYENIIVRLKLPASLQLIRENLLTNLFYHGYHAILFNNQLTIKDGYCVYHISYIV
ncbi:unnamed protein product [Rhizophagus irregularis]|uniref:Uncharacterized protein n=1 Tax=Rhizophagus irregularis TaxID=588596 RepID=A0A915YPR2_9GLOM|nr:unnamed protein product [Rhizophagus irregularis]CAB5167094.1 unnamed protein product [Rhizophagus irregularis]CAB5301344.1 unnamed protein product [Rhizophagus irregularis]